MSRVEEDKYELGDWVEIKFLKIKGEIVAIDYPKVKVLANNKLFNVSITALKLLKEFCNKDHYTSKKNIKIILQKNSFSTEIDLHGMAVKEAISVLDPWIDQALVNQVTRLKIIHGKGTGKLRSGVMHWLQKDSRVTKVIDQHIYAGGWGVTYIDL